MQNNLVVHDYVLNYKQILEIDNIKYNTNIIPKEIQLLFNIVSEENEEEIIQMIQKNNKTELTNILKCLSVHFSKKFNIKLNNASFASLKPGEGMKPTSEDDMYNSPVLILNLGSTILMKFKNKETKKEYKLLLPRRSLLIFDDKNKEYTREIEETKIDMFNNKEYIRKERYSLVFKSKIK